MDILFTLAYILTPIAVLGLLKIARIPFFTVSIPSVLLWFYFLFAYIGLFLLYFGIDEYREAAVVNREIVTKMFFFSGTSLLFISAGFVFVNQILRLQPAPVARSFAPLSKASVLAVIWIFVVCAIVLAMYLYQLRGIALFSALSGNVARAEILRSLATNAFPGKYYRYYLFFGQIIPFIIYILFADAIIKRRISSYLFFGAAFISAIFSAIMSLEKAPTAWLIIGMGLSYVLVRTGGRVSIKNLLILFGMLFSITSLLYTYFISSTDFVTVISSVFSRLLNGNLHAAYYYLEIFPLKHDYLWGSSFPNPGGIFPFEHYKVSAEVWKNIFPDLARQGIVGSSPAAFWAEIYANFGILPSLLVSFYVGVGIYLIQVLLSKLVDNTIKIALTVWLAMHIKDLSISSASSYIMDLYLWAILIIALALLLIEGKGRILLKHGSYAK